MTDNRFEQDPSRMKKYHEGWVQHQTEGKKGWTRYWMVLRGNVLFIFTGEDTHRNNMRGTLTLSSETELKSLPSESKKKGLKFELMTISLAGEKKVNKFKFDKENDRDVWKSFIIGISVGIVPSDVHLLPGQLKDVHVAMDEVRNTPPPLPTIPRPNIPRPKLNSHRNQAQGSEDGYDDNDSDGSGSFRSAFTNIPRNTSIPTMQQSHQGHQGQAMQSFPASVESGAVNNLRELMNRQTSLADKILDTPDGRGAGAYQQDRHHMERSFESSGRDRSFDTTARSFDTTARSYPSHDTRSPDSSFTTDRYGGWDTESVSTNRRQASIPDDRSVDTGFDEDPFNNNSMAHLFYLDSERNKEVPGWFYESCSRDEAENILTCGRKYGNVLVRPSSTFNHTGKYVISMRREVSGGTNLNHYEVVKQSSEGYKINVDNKHPPMRCLSEVMDFFVSVAGPGTKPMRSNDFSKIFGSTISNTRPSAPMFTEGRPYNIHHTISYRVRSNSPPQSPGVSTLRQESFDTNNFSRTMASSPPDWSNTSTSASKSLHVAGNVSDGIMQVVHEMNSDYGTKANPGGYSRQQSTDDSWSSYGGRAGLHQTVPAKTAPTETLQRQAGHIDHVTHDFDRMSFGDVPPPPPFIPPPPSSMMMGGAPPPPPPPTSSIPPPPPPGAGAAGGFPTPPRYNSATMGGNRYNRQDSNGANGQYGASQVGAGEFGEGGAGNMGFNTTPAGNRGLGPPKPTLEDQLRQRLVSQREQIYADGAVVLKNY